MNNSLDLQTTSQSKEFEQSEILIRDSLAQNSQTIWLQVKSRDRKLNLCSRPTILARALSENKEIPIVYSFNNLSSERQLKQINYD